MASPVRLAILTVSDALSQGQREDTSGDAMADWAATRGMVVVAREQVPDEEHEIRGRLERLAGEQTDLVLTTGGTGFTSRDVTPEATAAVIQRSAPGVAEALRAEGARQTSAAWLSRGVAGIRGRTLIVNLPGSTSGVRDGLRVLDDLVDHAVQLLRGTETHRHPTHG